MSEMRACNCVGPRYGEPVCPCMMEGYRRRALGEAALKKILGERLPPVAAEMGDECRCIVCRSDMRAIMPCVAGEDQGDARD